MLIEKEIIRPGVYWYRDESTGVPKKLTVTPELTKHWADQGQKMLSAGLTVPVPCEHDFDAHPMTPAEKLKNNAGWVKEYRLHDGKGGKGDRLFGIVDVQDNELAKKLPHTIRWTSPWINSFTDGQGRDWKNVISHLALTTRPRIVEQEPFPSIAAALSIAAEMKVKTDSAYPDSKGIYLSRAGLLFEGKKSKQLRPRYPLAFSIWGGGIKLDNSDMPMMKKKKPKPGADGIGSAKPGAKPGAKPNAGQGTGAGPLDDDNDFDDDGDDDTDGILEGGNDIGGMNPLADQTNDVGMEELLCDLLSALGVQMPESVGEAEFKRCLYEATMAKIKELATKGQAEKDKPLQPNPLNKPPAPGQPQQNPLINQEQQPMYMSLDDINAIADPTMRTIALSMYNENAKLRTEMEVSKKTTDSLRDAKLKEANDKRTTRVALLGKLSPRAKADLDAMLAMPAMALSLGDGGQVVDPMSQTLAVLEKGLADIPRLLTTDASALSVHAQPTDGDMLKEEEADRIADSMARMMGCPPEQKRAG